MSVHPFFRAGSDVWIMSTLAVGFLFINAAELIWDGIRCLYLHFSEMESSLSARSQFSPSNCW